MGGGGWARGAGGFSFSSFFFQFGTSWSWAQSFYRQWYSPRIWEYYFVSTFYLGQLLFSCDKRFWFFVSVWILLGGYKPVLEKLWICVWHFLIKWFFWGGTRVVMGTWLKGAHGHLWQAMEMFSVLIEVVVIWVCIFFKIYCTCTL